MKPDSIAGSVPPSASIRASSAFASRSIRSVSVLDGVGAAERIDRIGHAALPRDDLLRPQRDRRRFLGRQRHRFVAAVAVQRLRARPSPPPAPACATRTMLLSGCCAVSVLPAVCVWNRSCWARGLVAPNRSRMMCAHSRRAARNFATSSRKSLCALKKKDSRWPEPVDVEPGVDRRLHVGDRVRECERHLLDRRRARFADVIAADRDRVPVRQLAIAVGEDVGDDAERGAGRIDVGAARHVFLEDVVLDRAGQGLRVDPLLPRRPRCRAPAG